VRAKAKSAWSRRRAVPVVAAALLLVAGVIGVEAGCKLETRGPSVAEQARVPEFSLKSHHDKTVSLAELVRNGPAVIVFYRGHW
jgi:hypothetical protein